MSFLVLSYLERYYISLGEEASTSSRQGSLCTSLLLVNKDNNHIKITFF
jgi:hypothetical protein